MDSTNTNAEIPVQKQCTDDNGNKYNLNDDKTYVSVASVVQSSDVQSSDVQSSDVQNGGRRRRSSKKSKKAKKAKKSKKSRKAKKSRKH